MRSFAESEDVVKAFKHSATTRNIFSSVGVLICYYTPIILLA